MTDYQDKIQDKARRLMNRLRSLQNDRGAMADLRCAWSPTRRYRVWPWLAAPDLIGDNVAETVAGALGYHPLETTGGNFGTACCKLALEHAGAEQRFVRLLDADRTEACSLIRPLVLAIRSVAIPVNYEQLSIDLWLWGEGVKIRWAREFWTEPSQLQETPLAPQTNGAGAAS